MTPLLVLHRLGDPLGGAPWRAALASSEWTGPWSAFDQPGHGEAPWETDYYDPTHLVIAPLRFLHDAQWTERPVVIGVGEQAAAAVLLALGGRAAGLVLVEPPIAPPACDAATTQRQEYAWLRGIADDPDACAPAPPGRDDPRLAHGLSPRFDEEYVVRQRAAIEVPVLELAADSPANVLASVLAWWDSGADGR